jgi:hypothetical protein
MLAKIAVRAPRNLRLQKTLDLWRGPRRRDKDDGLTSEDVRRLGDDELIAYVERRQREAFEFTCDGAFQFQIFFRQGRALLAWIFEHWYDGEDPSVQIGIATVIDRRAPGEIGKRGRLDLTRHRVRYHHLPLVDVVSDPAKWDPAEVSRPDFPVLGYQQILADGADRLAVLLRTVVEPGAMPAVFHCIAGKGPHRAGRSGDLAASRRSPARGRGRVRAQRGANASLQRVG